MKKRRRLSVAIRDNRLFLTLSVIALEYVLGRFIKLTFKQLKTDDSKSNYRFNTKLCDCYLKGTVTVILEAFF